MSSLSRQRTPSVKAISLNRGGLQRELRARWQTGSVRATAFTSSSSSSRSGTAHAVLQAATGILRLRRSWPAMGAWATCPGMAKGFCGADFCRAGRNNKLKRDPGTPGGVSLDSMTAVSDNVWRLRQPLSGRVRGQHWGQLQSAIAQNPRRYDVAARNSVGPTSTISASRTRN